MLTESLFFLNISFITALLGWGGGESLWSFINTIGAKLKGKV